MLTHIRKIQKGLLLFVTVIICLAFGVFFSDFQATPGYAPDAVFGVYGKAYRKHEARKMQLATELALRLGMYDLVSAIGGRDAPTFAISRIVLREEGHKLGIVPTVDEVQQAVKALPIFMLQPNLNEDYVRLELLGPLGMTESDLFELVSDQVLLQRLRRLLNAGGQVSPDQVRRAYLREYQDFSGSLITVENKTFADQSTPTADEIKAYYEERKDSLLTEEKRGADLVFIPFPKPKEDVKEEEKAKAELDFRKQVSQIYNELTATGADFAAVLKKHNLEAKPVEPFAFTSPPDALKDKDLVLDALFDGTFDLNRSISVPVPWRHTDEKDPAKSDTSDSYYILRLTTLAKPEPMSLEQATPAVTTVLKNQKADKAAKEAAEKAAQAINESLKAGKPFAEAAKAAGVGAKELPTFSKRQPPAAMPGADLIVKSALEQAPNTVGEPFPLPDGQGYGLVYVEKVVLVESPQETQRKESIKTGEEVSESNRAFQAWFEARLKEAKPYRPAFGPSDT